jgi:Holliday junction resolvasome RuvABC DNA-binding subunit
MGQLEKDLSLLQSVKGVGKQTADFIIAYCGSLEGALKPNSLMRRGHIPTIGVRKAEFITNELKK